MDTTKKTQERDLIYCRSDKTIYDRTTGEPIEKVTWNIVASARSMRAHYRGKIIPMVTIFGTQANNPEQFAKDMLDLYLDVATSK